LTAFFPKKNKFFNTRKNGVSKAFLRSLEIKKQKF